MKAREAEMRQLWNGGLDMFSSCFFARKCFVDGFYGGVRC